MKIFLDGVEISIEELVAFMEEISYRVFPITTVQLTSVDKENIFLSTNSEYQ